MKTTLAIALLLVIAFFAIAVIARIRKGGGSSTAVAPYFAKTVLSEPEQVLFHRLREAIPEGIVLAQVAMPALLGIRKNSGRQSQFNVISRKYVDFVVCNPDFTMLAVVELDDSTHQRGDRIKADVVKDVAFLEANCRLIRFDVRAMPSVEEIKLAIG